MFLVLFYLTAKMETHPLLTVVVSRYVANEKLRRDLFWINVSRNRQCSYSPERHHRFFVIAVFPEHPVSLKRNQLIV